MKRLTSIIISCVLAAAIYVTLGGFLRRIPPGNHRPGEEPAEEVSGETHDRLFDFAPEIEGLEREISIGDSPRLVYRVKDKNPYKLEAGSYAGELRTGVYINEREGFAVALIPEVAGKIHEEYGKSEKGLIIPLEIIQNRVLPIYIFSVTRTSNGLGCLLIGFGGYMEIINTLQSTEQFVISSNSMDILLSRDVDTVNLRDYRILVPVLPEEDEAGCLIIYYISEDFLCEQTDLSAASFGDYFNIQVSSPLLICGLEQNLTEKNLFALKNRLGEDVPVFITAVSNN